MLNYVALFIVQKKNLYEVRHNDPAVVLVCFESASLKFISDAPGKVFPIHLCRSLTDENSNIHIFFSAVVDRWASRFVVRPRQCFIPALLPLRTEKSNSPQTKIPTASGCCFRTNGQTNYNRLQCDHRNKSREKENGGERERSRRKLIKKIGRGKGGCEKWWKNGGKGEQSK